ncbi:MAG: sigma-E factor negative regulatory protein [Lysobacteraceae bacterium]|jgi:hypothetical protein|nr:sigma-E factor negative regulatory protein [Xanthomonadaceae bacterium]MCZ8318199.1 sigma-E factor negative regulatory protein [Silanimonas sp.]
MTMPPATDDFREQMSAWHDGALAPEAARFVARRVLSDASLRDEVSRWQLAGDVLRRRAVARPPSDLAARVASALDREAAESRPVVVRAPRWAAAAVLVVAVGGLVGVLRPDEPSTAAATAARADVRLPVRAIRPAPVPTPVVVPPWAASPAESVAHVVPELMRAPQPTPEQLAPLPAVDVPARPWPRGAGHDPYVVDYRSPPPGR